jgi:hypothetical protein
MLKQAEERRIKKEKEAAIAKVRHVHAEVISEGVDLLIRHFLHQIKAVEEARLNREKQRKASEAKVNSMRTRLFLCVSNAFSLPTLSLHRPLRRLD